MRFVPGEEIAQRLGFPALIEALSHAFRADIEIPERHHHYIPRPDEEATILIMPAWTKGEASYLGIKVITIFPANLRKGIPSLTGSYLLLSGETGLPLAVMDGGLLTRYRTAAASALAARHLAREDSSRHLVIGAGALSPLFARAMRAVRPIGETLIWNRTRPRAEAVVAELAAHGIAATIAPDLEAAVRSADIVTSVTGALAPFLKGEWLSAGTHVDLVGAFKATMRESDDDCMRRSRIYVDTRNALHEPGDLIEPLRDGVIRDSDIQGDLFQLCRGEVPGRQTAGEITLFKSVGTAVEDLAAAIEVWRTLEDTP